MFDFSDFTTRMNKILELVGDELKLIRTGRAKPDMVDHIQVEAYEGQMMRLQEIASISAPDAQLLTITPWDKSTLPAIEKAIATSNLNLSPVVDGDMIRIAVPSLTEDRRKEMVKLVNQKIESGKNMMRDARVSTKKAIEKMKDQDGVSEDDIKAWVDDMQGQFNDFQSQLEDMGKGKADELMTL